jgi:D-arabinose 1-dehydrogenase-like Zn-dependent alcohol dehydrogenase
MHYCGICHTDLHNAAGHLSGIGMEGYPCVPGHELAGRCVAVGKNVTRVKVGDGVGEFVRDLNPQSLNAYLYVLFVFFCSSRTN